MILWLSSFLPIASSSHAAEPEPTQTITLANGWNLVSIQVGNAPLPVATFQANLSAPANLAEIWGYTPSGSPAVPGAWQTYQTESPHNAVNDLGALVPGRGYWVRVANGGAVFSMTGVAWNGTVTIAKGWNLVGFPGVSLATDEVQELSAVFGSHFDRIQQIWTFDTGTQHFKGYDLTAIPALKELASVSPGQGYWVYSIEDATISLTPQPFVALPADSDASPPQAAELFSSVDPRWLGSNPGKYANKQVRFRAGDGADTTYDLNANGILDDAYTQDRILYEIASEAIPVTVGNGGSGVVTWALENNLPWLYTAPANDRTWPAGTTTRPRNASGTVSSEKDIFILYADRTGLTPGRKEGDITLWVGGIAHVIRVLLDVAEVYGDWAGYANTTRANGKDISLGKVRLFLNVFLPTDAADNSFRAVLDSEQSILFPRPVYLEGVFYDPANQRFKMTTNFSMPAGDRNAPDYNTFEHKTTADFPGDPDAASKAARGDKDWNANDKADVMNPFPFGLRREVTLIGTRTSQNQMEGTYIEAIRGMLPSTTENALPGDLNKFLGDSFLTTSQPVFIEGTFVLNRRTFTPSQRSAFNDSVEPNVTVGGSGGGSRTETLHVPSSATVAGITVTLEMNLDQVDPELLRITLVSPDGHEYVLHDHLTALASSFTIPSSEIQAQQSAYGDWQLVIEWDDTSGERATLVSWGLKIEGLTTHSVTGRVVQEGSITPIPNASITLEGGIGTVGTTGNANGDFSFSGLSENDYTLVIRAPGFEPFRYTFFIAEADLALGDIEVPLPDPPITTPTLVGPVHPIGYEPLNVDLEVRVPVGPPPAQITWDFGDGSAPVLGTFTTLQGVSHRYLTAGHFTPSATLSGGSLASPVTVTLSSGVLVQRRLTSTTLSFTADSASDELTVGIACPPDDTVVRVSSDRSLPGGLDFATNYYVVSATTDKVKLATTLGGPPLDLTSAGEGLHSLTFYPADAPSLQVIAGIQMGSVAARMDGGANVSAANAFSFLSGEPQTEFEPEGGGAAVPMKAVVSSDTGRPLVSFAVAATGPAAVSATLYQESQSDSASFDLDRVPFGTSNWSVTRGLEDSDYGKSGPINSGGQVFIFYNTSATDNGTTATDEKWDARAWGTSPQPGASPVPASLPALPGTDLYQSDSTFATYTPAVSSRPDRLRAAITLGGAILSTEAAPSPMGDVFLLPGRTLK